MIPGACQGLRESRIHDARIKIEGDDVNLQQNRLCWAGEQDHELRCSTNPAPSFLPNGGYTTACSPLIQGTDYYRTRCRR